mgnify:CR=1 FL=1
MCMSVVNVFSVSNFVLIFSKLDKNIHDCIVTKLEYPFCFVNSRATPHKVHKLEIKHD